MQRMTQDVAFAAINFAMQNCTSSGLLFYGGEPLLERKLIEGIIEYSGNIRKKTGHAFYYKITTNGTLLDESFINMAKEANLMFGFSHDGLAQDTCRVFHNGQGSFSVLEEKIPMLLKQHPYSVGMSVINPSTVHRAAETVQFLFDKGFRYITQSLNYSRFAPWTQSHFNILKKEYEKMVNMYLIWTRTEEKFYLSPIDLKIISHIKGESYAKDRTVYARNQLSVAPDGKIYPGSKYIDNPYFEIGDVFSGIDAVKSKAAYEKIEIIPEPCSECTLRPRCNYVYDSISSKGDGTVRDVSPVQCAHEQLITPIADTVAEKLYKERNAMFMHKHYNKMYSVVSLVEDKGVYLPEIISAYE